MELPSAEAVTDTRIKRFKDSIGETLSSQELDRYRKVIEEYQHEHGVPVIDIAAALAAMAQGKKPMFMKESDRPKQRERDSREKPTAGREKPSPV